MISCCPLFVVVVVAGCALQWDVASTGIMLWPGLPYLSGTVRVQLAPADMTRWGLTTMTQGSFVLTTVDSLRIP